MGRSTDRRCWRSSARSSITTAPVAGASSRLVVAERMRAVVYDQYGPPEVQRLEEVDRPVPADDELLVRVHATSVTRTDAGLRSAELVISRFVTGIVRPKDR